MTDRFDGLAFAFFEERHKLPREVQIVDLATLLRQIDKDATERAAGIAEGQVSDFDDEHIASGGEIRMRARIAKAIREQS